jgi:hypothetical protein
MVEGEISDHAFEKRWVMKDRVMVSLQEIEVFIRALEGTYSIITWHTTDDEDQVKAY